MPARHHALPMVLVVLPPAILACALGLWGAADRSFWRDEGVTVGVTRRTVAEIIRFLGTMDAVHGAYYLLMHPIVTVFGSGELTLRFPSALATAVAAGGTACLGCRLSGPRVGLVAGLLYAGAPFTSRFAFEARPYALAMMAAVLTTLLLLRAMEGRGRRPWLAYGCAVVLLGMIHLFALLVVAAHVVSAHVMGQGRARIRRLLVTVAIAMAVLSPLIGLAVTQRGQVGWLTRPGWPDVVALLTLYAGSRALITATLAAAVVGAVISWSGLWLPRTRSRARARTLVMLAVPWLVIPPLVLLSISQVYPLYCARYVITSMPALSLLVSAGIARLPYGLGAPLLVAWGVMVAPVHVSARQPASETDQFRTAAQIIKREKRPGDVIVYLPTNRRAVAEAYPAAFTGLRDITLRVPPASAANLGGVEFGPVEIRRRLTGPAVTRVWLLEGEQLWRGGTLDALNRSKVDTLDHHFRSTRLWRLRGLTCTLFERS